MGTKFPHLAFPNLGRWTSVVALAFVSCAFLGSSRAFAQIDEDDAKDSPTPSVFLFASDDLPRDRWYVTADAIAMQRLNTGFDQAANLGKASTGSVALSENTLNDPFQPGVQLLIGHNFGDSPYSVEGSYFWLSATDVSSQVTDPNGQLYSPFTGFGTTTNSALDPNSLVQIHENSRLDTAELNIRRRLCLPAGDPEITFLFGVRHLELREEFDYTSQPTGNVNPVAVHAHTNNNLWGPQIGGSIAYGDRGAWLRLDGKVGVFNNDADRDLTATVNGATATHPVSAQSATAMVGDFSANFLWKPTAALTANLGYRAFWIDEVALGSRNFVTDAGSLTNSASDPMINQRGTLFYHGPFASIQVSW